MTQQSTDLQFNVAGLLKDPVGATRTYEFHEPTVLLDDGLVARDVTGSVRLLRINSGILAQASAAGSVVLECSRCLEPMPAHLEASFEEEYRPLIDVVTGQAAPGALEGETDEDFTRLTADHLLDLGEPLRQMLLVTVPYSPICRSDCSGLCPECGRNLNEGACGCSHEHADPRWAGLAALLVDIDDERGAS